MPRFNGIPLYDEEEKKPRFGGIPVSQNMDPKIDENEDKITATAYERGGIGAALLPATYNVYEKNENEMPTGFGGRLRRTVATAGDVLTLPARGVSALSTGLGTLHGGGSIKDAGREALKDLGRTKSEESGALGIAQDIALDPTSSPLLLSAGTALKGVKVASKAPTFGKALAGTALAGAGSGAGSAAYQSTAGDGNIDAGRVLTQAAIGAGTGALATSLGAAAKKGAGKLLKESAEKNIDITLRPGQTGRKMGYSHDAVIDYDLGGTPRQTYEKAAAKLSELQDEARAIAAKSDETFDLNEIFDAAASKLSAKNNPKNYKNQLALLDDLKKNFTDAFGDVVDAPTAMEVRTAIGKDTNFIGKITGGMAPHPDSKWQAEAYNELYNTIKNELHDGLGGRLKAINMAQSEIIPVKNVAERRIPIYESNNRIGLSDLLTANIGGTLVGGGLGYGTTGDFEGALKGAAIGAGAAGARKFLGSPTATKAMYKLGKALLGESDIAVNKAMSSVKKAGVPDETIEKFVNYDIPAFERMGKKLTTEDIVPIIERPKLSLNKFDTQGVEIDKDYLKYLLDKAKPPEGVYRGIYRNDIRKW